MRISCRLEDGEEGGEEGDLDAGDGGEAEEAIFDLGDELGVGGVVGGGSVEGDAGDEARGEAGDRGAGRVGIRGECGGADKAGGDDVALELRRVGSGQVAVAKEGVEVGGGRHGLRLGDEGGKVSLNHHALTLSHCIAAGGGIGAVEW